VVIIYHPGATDNGPFGLFLLARGSGRGVRAVSCSSCQTPGGL